MGPNFVLDKGFKVGAASSATFGYACELNTADTTGGGVILAAGTNRVLGVFQETLDAAKVATGKATVDVRIMGITRGVTNGVIAMNAPVFVDATGAFVAAGAAGTKQAGIALTASAGAGGVIDVLLTPYAAVSS